MEHQKRRRQIGNRLEIRKALRGPLLGERPPFLPQDDKQLKGFRKVNLGPGESKEVSFSIDKETLSFYRADMSFGPESGEFKVFIGGASDNVKEASFSYEE